MCSVELFISKSYFSEQLYISNGKCVPSKNTFIKKTDVKLTILFYFTHEMSKPLYLNLPVKSHEGICGLLHVKLHFRYEPHVCMTLSDVICFYMSCLTFIMKLLKSHSSAFCRRIIILCIIFSVDSCMCLYVCILHIF